MTFAPPVAAPTAPEAECTPLAPLLLPQDLRLSPEQFALVCQANPDAVLELAADGQLITMTPRRRRNRSPQHTPADPAAVLGRSARRLGGVRQLYRLPPA
jgi:hypothetical protein